MRLGLFHVFTILIYRVLVLNVYCFHVQCILVKEPPNLTANTKVVIVKNSPLQDSIKREESSTGEVSSFFELNQSPVKLLKVGIFIIPLPLFICTILDRHSMMGCRQNAEGRPESPSIAVQVIELLLLFFHTRMNLQH